MIQIDSDPHSFQLFQEQIANIDSVEEKLKYSLHMMKLMLDHPKGPNFKDFWEIRKVSLQLFKEAIPQHTRAAFWDQYMDLTRQARMVREQADENSRFAQEQIDLAITALEKDLEFFFGKSSKTLPEGFVEGWPPAPKVIEREYCEFQQLQHQIELLNLYASKVNALRKELLSTLMRGRQKSKFFERLSHLGDLLFPKRKELVLLISERFSESVQRFIDQNFSEARYDAEKIRRSLFYYREQIKALQGLAKILSLNTQTFSKTREGLSGCWEQLRGMEKELKKEFAEHKILSNENVKKVEEKINELSNYLIQQTWDLQEGEKKIEEIQSQMRSLSLTRADVQLLKDQLQEVSKPLQMRRHEEKIAMEQKVLLQKKERQEALDNHLSKVAMIQAGMENREIDSLFSEVDILRKESKSLALTKHQRQTLERKLKELFDALNKKKQEQLLTLSGDDKLIFEKLNQMILEKGQERKQVKEEVELLRRKLGGSTLDIEQAMELNEQMACKKQQLEQIDCFLEELQEKIDHLS